MFQYSVCKMSLTYSEIFLNASKLNRLRLKEHLNSVVVLQYFISSIHIPFILSEFHNDILESSLATFVLISSNVQHF